MYFHHWRWGNEKFWTRGKVKREHKKETSGHNSCEAVRRTWGPVIKQFEARVQREKV